MMTYVITWNEKSKTVKAESAREAIVLLGRRLVFGSCHQFGNLSNWNVDADTYGQRWASCATNNAAGDRFRVTARLAA